jgi:hypothetical protein
MGAKMMINKERSTKQLTFKIESVQIKSAVVCDLTLLLRMNIDTFDEPQKVLITTQSDGFNSFTDFINSFFQASGIAGFDLADLPKLLAGQGGTARFYQNDADKVNVIGWNFNEIKGARLYEVKPL